MRFINFIHLHLQLVIYLILQNKNVISSHYLTK